MGSRLYIGAVVVVWLAAMSWLVTERILPPFFRGEPPVTGTLRQTDPVAWRVEVDDQPCGFAVMQAIDRPGGVISVRSRLRLDRLPSPKGSPAWLTPLVESLGEVSFDMWTEAGFDSMRRLSTFKTLLNLGRNEDLTVRINGIVKSGKLMLSIRVGELTKSFSHDWPAEGLLADELLPESKLLPIYPGLQWQKEVYSPFASPNQPIEILEATVLDEIRRLSHDGRTIDARVVEYRGAQKAGFSEADRLRATLFVADDGRVIRQEAKLLGSRLIFDRLGETPSARMATKWLESYSTNPTKVRFTKE